MKFISIDIETTGLDPQKNQILEFGAVAIDTSCGITKHIPDFMSKYGIEQATGCQWIWGSENYQDYEERKKVFGGHRDHPSHSGSRASNWPLRLGFALVPRLSFRL